jgi:hypothetical protein
MDAIVMCWQQPSSLRELRNEPVDYVSYIMVQLPEKVGP